jgi:hypothetical protein
MAKAVSRKEWDYVSLIWATLANANRDEKKRPQPFSPADIHPLRTPEEYETPESREPDWAMIGLIRKQYKVTTLHGQRLETDQGGGSVS